MKYGVIICSKCKKIKAVDLSNKTSKCIYCGRTLNIRKIKIFYKSDNLFDIQSYVGYLNIKLEKNKIY
jgi:hypothetical protein